MEKNLEKMVKRVVLKLVASLARTMFNLVSHSRGDSAENPMMGILESGLQAILRETLQQEDGDTDNDNNNNDGEEVVAMQMVNQHQDPEATDPDGQSEPGATAQQQKSKKLPRLPSSHVKIPPKAKKRRKRKY